VDGTLKSAPHYKEKSRPWVSIKPFVRAFAKAVPLYLRSENRLLPRQCLTNCAKFDINTAFCDQRLGVNAYCSVCIAVDCPADRL
jgi:hypothetical protein